jgi:hypothetical protein
VLTVHILVLIQNIFLNTEFSVSLTTFSNPEGNVNIEVYASEM